MDTTAEILTDITELKLKLAVKRKQQRVEKLKVERERRRVEHENYKKSAAEVKKIARLHIIIKNKKSKKKHSIYGSSESTGVWLSSKSKGRKKISVDENELDRRRKKLYHISSSGSKLIDTSSRNFDFEECGKVDKLCMPPPSSTKILHSAPKNTQKKNIKTLNCKKLNLKVDAQKRIEAKIKTNQNLNASSPQMIVF
jgi:hypothetical protein